MSDDGYHEITALRAQLAAVTQERDTAQANHERVARQSDALAHKLNVAAKERDAFRTALLADAVRTHKQSAARSWSKHEHHYVGVLIVTTRNNDDDENVTAEVRRIDAT